MHTSIDKHRNYIVAHALFVGSVVARWQHQLVRGRMMLGCGSTNDMQCPLDR